MTDPLAVLAVIALEAAAGAAVLTVTLGLWGVARRGFFTLMGVSVALLVWAGWGATRAGLDGASVGGFDPAHVVLAAALLASATVLALLLRSDRAAGLLGSGAAAAIVAGLVVVALVRDRALLAGAAEVLLGAALLGAALYGLVLGHWYLFERGLDNRHMVRAAQAYSVGCAAGAGGALLSATNPAPLLGGFSPFLAVPGFSVYLALGLVAVCALIAGFVWKLATEGGRSIQAATGLMYLAVIMAFSAELSAKVRFFVAS